MSKLQASAYREIVGISGVQSSPASAAIDQRNSWQIRSFSKLTFQSTGTWKTRTYSYVLYTYV